MSNPDQVAAHIQDSVNLYCGHRQRHAAGGVHSSSPAATPTATRRRRSSTCSKASCKKIVDQVEASPYAKDTAIFITFDEGGGYYDSGYVQPLDFFGDGTRIPLIVVSPYVEARATSRTTTPTTSRSSSSSSATGVCRRSRTAAATTSRTRSPTCAIPTCR